MATLSVNFDHVATVREARKAQNPDPVAAAVLCELAGAHGITCHLREDRRHIQDRDLLLLKKTIHSRLNLEMAPTDAMVRIALEHSPTIVTLVPEKRMELTTEGGLNAAGMENELKGVIQTLQNHNILVSLFVDPDLKQLKAAAKIKADYIELHTGHYANVTGAEKAAALDQIKNMALAANKFGLGVNAGHGLDYVNTPYIAAIDFIEELNIGHSIIARAVLVGLDQAVRDMLALMKRQD